MFERTVEKAHSAYHDCVRNLATDVRARIQGGQLTEDDLTSSLVCRARDAWSAYQKVAELAAPATDGQVMYHPV